MKVLHLMLACFYIDNYSYQENYLPKHHKLQGHDVEIIASLVTFDEKGRVVKLPATSKYINEYGIPVTRLAYKNGKLLQKMRRYKGLRQELERVNPDIIFIHGVQFLDVDVVADYCKKHPGVKVFADNHSDFSNSAKTWVSKNVLHRIIWRHCAQKINPYVTKFFGVLPARVDFLINEYKLPKDKVELLVMGADDECVIAASAPEVRKHVREQFGIGENDILIVSGGKIDQNKPQTLKLMETVNGLDNDRIKMLVFGTVVPELQVAFDAQLSERVKFAGWKKSNEIYQQFAAADIVAFPGLHSVLWEQAVAMGKPCIFKKLAGFQHIDLDGNCLYFQEETKENYMGVICTAVENLESMKETAQLKGFAGFAYSKIAEKSIAGGM